MSLPKRLLLLAWIAGVSAVTMGALAPDGYAQYVLRQPEPRPCPCVMVGQFLLVMTVEVLALAATIRPASFQRAWGRVLLALLLALGLAFAHRLTLMHAPPYMVWHVLWLFAVAIVPAPATGVSVISAVLSRHLQRA